MIIVHHLIAPTLIGSHESPDVIVLICPSGKNARMDSICPPNKLRIFITLVDVQCKQVCLQNIFSLASKVKMLSNKFNAGCFTDYFSEEN